MAKFLLPALMKAAQVWHCQVGFARELVPRSGLLGAVLLSFRYVLGSLRSAQSELPKRQAVSTGRCNTGLKFTCGSFNAQSFPRALIEAQRYFVEIDENSYVACHDYWRINGSGQKYPGKAL
jgi:hypothetical protein